MFCAIDTSLWEAAVLLKKDEDVEEEGRVQSYLMLNNPMPERCG